MRPCATNVRGLKLLVYAALCWCMLTYADVCWRMLTYADVCWRLLTYADVCWRRRRRSRLAKSLNLQHTRRRILRRRHRQPRRRCYNIYMCATIHMCPHTKYVSSYYICVLILQYTARTSSTASQKVLQLYSYISVSAGYGLVLLYMCPHTTIHLSSHATTYVSSYWRSARRGTPA
jgi:hypothetical protein